MLFINMVCLTVASSETSSENGGKKPYRLHLKVDGHEVITAKPKVRFSLHPGASIQIGRFIRSSTKRAMDAKAYVFEGEFTDLEIWDYVLTDAVLEDASMPCPIVRRAGNLMEWFPAQIIMDQRVSVQWSKQCWKLDE
jgi:hypothetical protein